MINFNWVFNIWLTAFVVTSRAWIGLNSGVKAQSTGTITIDNSKVVLNGTIPTDSITTNRSDISGNLSNSMSNGGK
ncbi:hypothetical protein NIES2101_27055 [Calothrix sp. HK-06]|nr:hypothetical protein NIES2101_27055 [Calothrix sp. HK-06]